MAAKSTYAAEIAVSPEQIPEVKEPMPVLMLGAKIVAPDALLRDIIGAVSPNAVIREFGHAGARAAHDGQRLVAFINPKTGESSVFPALEALKPGPELADRARRVAAHLAQDTSIFPEDGTEIAALAPVTLMGARRSRDGKRTSPAEYLAFARYERRVDGLPVFGPGTTAMIAVAADDAVHGFAHRWRSVALRGEEVTPLPRSEIVAAIRTQLAAGAKTAEVTVDKIRLGYYGGEGQLLQPVYRFEATLVSRAHRLRVANRRVFGHLSIGKAPEPLPVLGAYPGELPAEPCNRLYAEPLKSLTPSDPTVGRYVVRDEDQGWVASANSFMANLQQAAILGSPIPFTDSQYFWAEPFEFLAEKNAFVNAVNIALTEVHGNWGLFSTRDNHDDLVLLDRIPAGGYGGVGALAYWIVHACELMPTQTDESTSFDAWWKIFNGLHAAMGYRTEMWIDDGVTGPFGLFVGLGAPVISAWFSSIAANSNYGGNDAGYFDCNRQRWEPMGRASAIAVCGHGDDTAKHIAPLGPPSCLTEWWFGD